MKMKRLWPVVVILLLCGCSDPEEPSQERDAGTVEDAAGGDADDEDADSLDTGSTDSGESPDVDPGDPDADADADPGDPDADTPDPTCTPSDTPQYDFYASPTGQPGAAGTSDDPLDLATALSSSGPVGPGDRVALKEGTYTGAFVSELAGTSSAPIIVEAEPGARVILDSAGQDAESGLVINGEWGEFHGLELTSSGADRQNNLSGVTIYGPNTKLVNSVIHNTAQGVSFWTPAVDSELYGNIIFNNGYEGPSRGHGHAIYMQNADGTKRLEKNIIFFGYGFGIHAYTEGGSIQGFDLIENVWFRAGASRPGSSTEGTSDNCLIGGLQPVARTQLIGNHSWAPETSSRNVRIGWGGSVQNEDITVIDNYFVGYIGFQGHWESGTIHGNTFHSETGGIHHPDYPNNTYDDQLPSGSRVVVQPNDYDERRADLIIYNFDDADTVTVDLSNVLEEGVSFEIFSVFDLQGTPVFSGSYGGADIEVPMGTVDPPQPNGDPNAITGADNPGKTFGVFVVRWSC